MAKLKAFILRSACERLEGSKADFYEARSSWLYIGASEVH